ncbi:hypothetical protein J2TS6_41650 [Paenibacillus albilobatus]|uniref:DUF4367 domain-containing protein n=1 Tax=Paenibacillus albilobatus TaxID=2716884 RepID=A0A920CDN6_9BACL|nr:hypothetical protein [Paenibacillus albilobatus]GIO33024.1 hypothetical protein J2TS6_41650 [Paenibacillus albilobatus]
MLGTKLKTVISLVAVMGIAGTVSAYASTSSVSPKDLNNKVAVSMIKADPKPATVQDQIDKLYASLKPGQVIAYYVKDLKLNPSDRISFAGRGFVFQKYNDYLAKIKNINAPSLAKPASLPKGYTFKAGFLYPQNPDPTSALYEKLDKELKEQAAQGKKILYTKPLEVVEESSAVLTFVKNKVEVSVVASFVKPSDPIGGTPVPGSNPDQKTETLGINGVECTYTTELNGRDHLDWTDSANQVHYSISAKNAKTDVINFAKSMVKK